MTSRNSAQRLSGHRTTRCALWRLCGQSTQVALRRSSTGTPSGAPSPSRCQGPPTSEVPDSGVEQESQRRYWISTAEDLKYGWPGFHPAGLPFGDGFTVIVIRA